MWYCYNSVITLVHIFCGFVNLEKIDNNNNNNNGHHFSRILPHSGWILRISPYSVQMRENAGKMRTRITPDNKYGHFLRSLYFY